MLVPLRPGVLRAPGPARHAPLVMYLVGLSGTINITSQVETGTFVTASVSPAASVFIRLVISARKLALKGTKGSWTVTATSVAEAAKSDLVRARAKVT